MTCLRNPGRLGPAAALAVCLSLVAGAPAAEESVSSPAAPVTEAASDVAPAVRIDRAALSLRASTWSRSRRLDGDTGVNAVSAWFVGKAALGESGKAVVDAWARSDSHLDGRLGASDARGARL